MRLAVLLLLAALSLGDGLPPRIAIVRARAIVLEGETVRVLVQVDPQPENRFFVLAAVDAQGVVRASRQQLDGEQAARSWWIEWQSGLPPGELELVAVLITTAGATHRARHLVLVRSRL